MWIAKKTGLTWDQAQQALKDGLHIGHAIWHTTIEGAKQVRIVLDKDWNLITKPPAPAPLVLPAGAELPPPVTVGKWKPSQPEYDSNEWIAWEWQEA